MSRDTGDNLDRNHSGNLPMASVMAVSYTHLTLPTILLV